ncbi:MAG: hypothetical protein E7172_05565 [Firmicutes bacterium]|nr:hypothetical protein [Bacillota bacterium]
MNKAILTLPMMPVDGNNYGKFVTPIICETLSNIFECNYYHCVNILDSFNDRNLKIDSYVKSLDENNIHYDKLWYDNENISKFLANIDILIKKGYISEMNSIIYRCDCGIVEIEKNKINSCNPNNLKFTYNNDKLVCKHCGTVCKEYNEKILVFVPKNITLKDIKILPGYLNKDIKTYENTVLKSYTTISRNRNTGFSVVYNGRKYNIDIDFLWETYLNTFSEKEKIVVSGNRMVYQLFLVSVLEKCLVPNNNTILIGTPYITNIKDILKNPNFINDEELRKLFIIFNTKWQKKEILYDETILKYLNKISNEKRKQLYDIINMPIKQKFDFYSDLEKTLKNHLNMQESVKRLKLERR